MLCISRDRKKIIDCVSLGISRSIGGKKDEKYLIIGTAGFGTAAVADNIMAAFPDEKSAMDELERVFNAFAEGARSYKF